MNSRKALFACALASLTLHAQSASAISISLKDALVRAEQMSPQVLEAERGIEVAKAYRVGAGVVMPVNPTLSIDARPLLRSDAPTPGYSALLQTMFEVGGAPSARVREADERANVAQSASQVVRLDSGAATWEAYVRAQIAALRIEQIESTKRIAEQVLDASKQRVALGAASDIEESLITLEIAGLNASLRRATRELGLRTMALRQLLNLKPEEPITLTTPIELPPGLPPQGELVERAKNTHPQLALVQKQVGWLDATYTRLGRERFPRVGVYTGVTRDPEAPIYGVVGLSVELPFAQRNQGPRAIVERERDLQVNRRALLLQRIERDVLAAYGAYETSRQELATLINEAIPAAERTRQLVEVGWRAGRFDIFRVTATTRDLLRVQGERLDALETVWLQRIAIHKAMGSLALW